VRLTGLGTSRLLVTRSPEAPRERYSSESAFWYALRNELRTLGYDVIKKRMSKDGHLVSEGVFYVRARKQPGFMVWDGLYAGTRRCEGFQPSRASLARHGGAMKIHGTEVDKFTASYIEAAFWSSTDELTPDGGAPLDKNYDFEDLAPETLARVIEECRAFQATNGHLFAGREESAGHDFWLTRNHHGAGFWDGDWPEPAATVLDAASKTAGERNLYVGDDGRVYCHQG
jgi:hypothetical protein